jgi:type I site-specific restriction endonuclease
MFRLNEVKRAISKNSDKTLTITLSCGRLTTGISVPEWTGILMLSNLSSVQAYMQTIFRVKTPGT